VVGALLGALLGGLWWGTARLWPAGVAAALVVGADLALTGLLHLDGLADSADGLLPPVDRARRLAIMRDPRLGAFGLAVGGVVLLTRWAALAALAPGVLLLAGLWAASRTLMAVVALRLPYARAEDGGLATAFRPPPTESRRLALVTAGAGGALSAGAVVAWRPLPGAVSLVAGLAAGAGVVALARRRLGGFTGDVLGAAGVVTETVGLVVAAARW
jgi:adenosylcobinamide-GDP ribazoletransferase